MALTSASASTSADQRLGDFVKIMTNVIYQCFHLLVVRVGQVAQIEGYKGLLFDLIERPSGVVVEVSFVPAVATTKGFSTEKAPGGV